MPFTALLDAMTNHEGDRHVLAAAVHAAAGVIVTWNDRHFPPDSCAPYGIDVQSPDQFLCHLWDLSPEEMAAVLVEQAAALVNPPRTPRQVVEALRDRGQLRDFAAAVFRSGLI